MKLCPNCGRSIPDDSEVCPFCGHIIKEEEIKTVKVREIPKSVVLKELEPIMEKFSDKYELIGLLGKGGFSEVFLIKDKLVGRECALKILSPDLTQGFSEMMERFKREARLYAELEHPNIVPIYDLGFYEETAYIIMKYIKGKTLKDIIKQSAPLPIEKIKFISEGILSALNYMHTKGIIHRDIKPANIIIEDGTNKAILADFGLAKRIEGKSHLTRTGEMLGTPHYLSPEQAKGEKITTSSDIYSYGITLFEMATGVLPFRADTPLQVLWKHVREPLPSPSRINPNISPSLESIIKKATEKKPKNRYRTADEMLGDVKKLKIESTILPKYRGSSAGTITFIFILGALILSYIFFRNPINNAVQTAYCSYFASERGENKYIITPKHQRSKTQKKKEIKEKAKKNEKEKATPEKPTPPPTTGSVVISSNLESEVTINGKSFGKVYPGKLREIELPPGKYIIGFKAKGYPEEKKKITIKAGGKRRRVERKFPLFGIVDMINCTPWCDIYIDGKLLGSSPKYNIKLGEGKHKITLKKSGYKTIIDEIFISPNEKIKKKIYILKKETEQ